MNKRNALVVLAGVSLGTVVNVMAHETPLAGPRLVQESVRYDDLDMAKTAGLATLHWRLRMAANLVCGKANQPRYACREDALARALADAPAAVREYHTQWKLDGANWLQQPKPQSSRRVVSSR